MKWKDFRKSTNVEIRERTEEEDRLMGLSMTPNQTVAEGHYQIYELETLENVRRKNQFDRYLREHAREPSIALLPRPNKNYDNWVKGEKKERGTR